MSRPIKHRNSYPQNTATWIAAALLVILGSLLVWANFRHDLILIIVFVTLSSVPVAVLIWTTDNFKTLRNVIEVVSFFWTKWQEPDEAAQSAARAVRRTNAKQTAMLSQLADIGLLTYAGNAHPHLVRSDEVATSTTHIRPFAVVFQPRFWCIPYEQVDFNLFDQDHRLRYTFQKSYRFSAVKSFIAPPTWLPLEEQNVTGIWSLEVMLGNTRLGIHEFRWLHVGGELRAQLDGDGEIDPHAPLWTELDFDKPISLDDLLVEQESGVSQTKIEHSV